MPTPHDIRIRIPAWLAERGGEQHCAAVEDRMALVISLARENVKRTVFAVGDEKQSIFSFQGARPREFDTMRRFFERQFDTPEQGWRFLRFHRSFRSGQSVLGSVDRVFAAREVYTSITTDEVGIPEHQALPDSAPGLVELCPLLQAADKREIEGWDAPFDTESLRPEFPAGP